MEIKPIFIVAIIALMAISTTTGGVYAKHLTDDQRYNSGYNDGCRDANAGNQDVIDNYQQSSAYLGHSELYHQGYNAALDSCLGQNSSQDNPIHYTKVSGHDNSDNSNQNNRVQPQGQTSKQTVFCVIAIGTCPTTSGQTQNLQN